MARISSHFQFLQREMVFCGYSSGKSEKVEMRVFKKPFFGFSHVIIDRGKQMRDRGFLGLATAR